MKLRNYSKVQGLIGKTFSASIKMLAAAFPTLSFSGYRNPVPVYIGMEFINFKGAGILRITNNQKWVSFLCMHPKKRNYEKVHGNGIRSRNTGCMQRHSI